MQYLVSLLGVEGRYIAYDYDPAYPFDVEVVLGIDWASHSNLPNQ